MAMATPLGEKEDPIHKKKIKKFENNFLVLYGAAYLVNHFKRLLNDEGS